MTRRDFELIAKAVRDAGLSERDRLALARAFAVRLATTNTRFDEERFVEACNRHDD